MKYDDLEKTKDLFGDEVPEIIEDIEMEGATKDNIEIDSQDKEEKFENKDKKKKNWFTKLKEMPKKKKVILIIVILLILLLIIGLVLFLVFKKTNEEDIENKEPDVIVEKGNYTYKNGKLELLNNEDNILGTYECQNKDENLCYVVNYSNEDNFDVEKNYYQNEEEIERLSKIYLEKYVFIFDNEDEKDSNIILYNIEEQKEENEYTLVKGFVDSDYVILKDKENKYGAIEFSDGTYQEKIEFKYDYLGLLNKDSNIVGKLENKYSIYDRNGKELTEKLDYEIKSYNDKAIVVDNDGYSIYDYNCILTSGDITYDYIELINDYIILIKDKKLYVKDYENNKYNEVGINLRNTNYLRKNIYDKEKTKLETKKAYDIEVNNGQINVTVYNNDTQNVSIINIYEGMASSKIKNLNYFDGKLYFYEDEAKNILLGEYSCNNKNVLDKNNMDLVNCRIATESFYSKNEVEVDYSASVGWIPIFNKRFAFILDTIDANNPTVNLYDLKDKETLSKYESVDALSYTKENNLTFKDIDNAYIMAKTLTKGKYGVLNITKDNIKGSKIGFDYDTLEKLNNYYVGKSSSKTYVLLDPSKGEVSSKFGDRIVNYKNNYIVVCDNSNYYLYNKEGNRIDYNSYKYIDLDDGFYVVITNDYRLDILKYNDYGSFSLSQTIQLNRDTFKDDYEVTKEGNEYIVKIKSSNNVYKVDGTTGYVREDFN